MAGRAKGNLGVGVPIGYDPKKIHNVAEPPPVNEEDLPSCPVLK